MTNPINVHVKTRYLAKESRPEQRRYVYAYEIEIENQSDETAQLISRYWRIIDSNDQTQEVQGIGVVGQQPTLEPGASYKYTSGVVIETETGMMQGSYTLRGADGDEFEAEIPAFALVKPSALH